VSGSTITFGEKTTFNGANTYWISAAPLSAAKFAVVCQDGGNLIMGPPESATSPGRDYLWHEIRLQ